VVQIIGRKGCAETRKALRFCQERSLEYQFVDLNSRPLSPGEYNNIFSVIDPASLIDEASSHYKKGGYQWRVYDAQEELIEHPNLLRIPILRRKGRVVVGFDPSFLEER
jgi:arsenate reductase